MSEQHVRAIASLLLLLTTFELRAVVRYVNLENPEPSAPYLSWLTAATNIQQAIDLAQDGDEIVVTNGIYASGGTLASDDITTNRVAVTRAVTLRSVNGPSATVIKGYQIPGVTNGPAAVRCVYLASGATLVGFTLTGGATTEPSFTGGGISGGSYSAVVSNCVITSNSAYFVGGGACNATLNNCTITGNNSTSGGGIAESIASACVISGNLSYDNGGGARYSTLTNCTITGNSASYGGGGAAGCTVVNCVLNQNTALRGGGAYQSTLYNCTVVGNSSGGFTATGGGTRDCTNYNTILYYNTNTFTSTPNYVGGLFSNCCTTPGPGGTGNFRLAPLFVDQQSDFHLQPSSPCINAGMNGYVQNSTDLDGNPRISAGTVDVGAYEFKNPGSVISSAWLVSYGLPQDGSADHADPDGDGMDNWKEWICGTNPTNAVSVLKMLAPSNAVTGIALRWQSIQGKVYSLQRAGSLSPATEFFAIQTNISGQTNITSFTDVTATGRGPFFYRVAIQ